MGQLPVRPCREAIEEHIGIWSFDVASGLSFMDPPISELFGIDAQEAARGVGCERIMSHIHPDDREPAIRETERVLQAHDLFSWFYQLQMSDGSIENVHATGRCFQDADGRPTHIAGILTRVGTALEKSVQLEVMEGLAYLRDLSRLTPDPMLPRLLDAVLLHMGKQAARELGGPVGQTGSKCGNSQG